VPITYTSQEQVEVYRFSLPAAILIPLMALFLQAFVPLRLHFFSMFDLPLLVVIFFAVARRSQVAGLLTGSLIGLLQDSSHRNLWHRKDRGWIRGILAGSESGCGKRRCPISGHPIFLRRPRNCVLHGGAWAGEVEPGMELGARIGGGAAQCRNSGGSVYAAGSV